MPEVDDGQTQDMGSLHQHPWDKPAVEDQPFSRHASVRQAEALSSQVQGVEVDLRGISFETAIVLVSSPLPTALLLFRTRCPMPL